MIPTAQSDSGFSDPIAPSVPALNSGLAPEFGSTFIMTSHPVAAVLSSADQVQRFNGVVNIESWLKQFQAESRSASSEVYLNSVLLNVGASTTSDEVVGQIKKAVKFEVGENCVCCQQPGISEIDQIKIVAALAVHSGHDMELGIGNRIVRLSASNVDSSLVERLALSFCSSPDVPYLTDD